MPSIKTALDKLVAGSQCVFFFFFSFWNGSGFGINKGPQSVVEKEIS